MLLLALCALSPACVLRKLHLRSEPPGAEVFLDGRSVGTTPYEEDFQWYGTHRVELRLPGYVRHIQLLEVERPWWQVFPLSFITEVLWPFEIRDEHALELSLQPLPTLSTAEVDAAARAAYERLVEVRALAPGGSRDSVDEDVAGEPARPDRPADPDEGSPP